MGIRGENKILWPSSSLLGSSGSSESVFSISDSLERGLRFSFWKFKKLCYCESFRFFSNYRIFLGWLFRWVPRGVILFMKSFGQIYRIYEFFFLNVCRKILQIFFKLRYFSLRECRAFKYYLYLSNQVLYCEFSPKKLTVTSKGGGRGGLESFFGLLSESFETCGVFSVI